MRARVYSSVDAVPPRSEVRALSLLNVWSIPRCIQPWHSRKTENSILKSDAIAARLLTSVRKISHDSLAQGEFSRVLLHQSRSTLRSERKLLQSLINRKLFMRNDDAKILTAQETWDLITNLVEEALSPPYGDEEHDGT